MDKKFIIVLVALVLSVTCTIGVTLAWLVDTTGPVTNTFTVGKVDIDLDEAKVTAYGVVDGTDRVMGNEYKLIPGHTYVKDPTITVKAGSEACYVFVKVENGLAAIIDATTIEDQIVAKGWTKLPGVDNVYYKVQDAVTADTKLVVFENFTIKSEANVADYVDEKIVINGYAIQTDETGTAPQAWAKLQGQVTTTAP